MKYGQATAATFFMKSEVSFSWSSVVIFSVILAMAADATGFMTGAYLPVSGGTLML